jgi:hypothetical protein
MKLPSLLSFAIPCLFLVACGGEGNLPPDGNPPSGSGKLIAELHFADPLLERCVYDAGKLWVSELTELRCVPDEDRTVRDATGIEQLVSLQRLDLSGSELSELDLSANTALTHLTLSAAQLTELDLTANKALTNIDIFDTALHELDLSENTLLKYLDIRQTPLTLINLSKNKALIYLDLVQTSLSSIDLRENTNLNGLNLSNNRFTEVDVSANTKITDLNLSSNQLSSFNAPVVNSLRNINLRYNAITNINLSTATALVTLNVANNRLTRLDLTLNQALTQVNASFNELSTIELAQGGQLAALEVQVNPALTCLYLRNIRVQFPLLDMVFSGNCPPGSSSSSSSSSSSTSSSTSSSSSSSGGAGTRKLVSDIHFPDPALANCVLQTTMAFVDQLVELRCNGVVDTTGLEQLVALKKLNLNSTKITSIDLTGMPELIDLVIYQMNLKELDLSKNTELRYLELTHFYELNGLDLSANLKIGYIQLRGYSTNKFSCSSHQAIINRFPRAFVDGETECRTEFPGPRKLISDIHFPDPALANCVSQKHLTFVDELVDLRCGEVADATGLEQLFALKNLHIDPTQLTALDLTRMTQLNNLTIYRFNGTELDLSKNTALRFLELSHFYLLNSLDLSANLELVSVQLRGYSPSKFSCPSYYAITGRFPRAFGTPAGEIGCGIYTEAAN